MGATLRAPAEIEKPTGARTYPSKGTNVRKFLPFELFLREIWPEDRTKNYMRVTGAKPSTAKLRVRGKRLPDYEEIVALIRSPHGWDWIMHALGDERPGWFVNVDRAKSIGETRKLQAQIQRRLAQLEMQIE